MIFEIDQKIMKNYVNIYFQKKKKIHVRFIKNEKKGEE